MIIMPYKVIGNPHDAPLIDERERQSDLFQRLDARDLPYKRTTLHKGDFTVSQRVGGEIKRVKKINHFVKKELDIEDYNDLYASLKDERIYSEIGGLEELYDINVLIVQIEEGADFITPLFPMKAWQSLTLSLEIGYNTHIYKTQTTDETIDLIYALWERERKGKHYESASNKKPRPKSLFKRQQYLLSGLEDVGDKNSAQLLKEYETPFNIFKEIVNTQVSFTKGGNPRRPKNAPPGFGAKFFLKNQELLLGDND